MNLNERMARNSNKEPQQADTKRGHQDLSAFVTDRRMPGTDRRSTMDPSSFGVTDDQMRDQLAECQECERTRIAADLHDSIGSSLSATKFGLEAAIKRLEVEASHVPVEPLVKIASEIKRTIDEVRRIAMNLRPSILDDLGIVTTIGWFCREFEGCYQNVRLEKQISAQEKNIPAELKTPIFRILQEATNNAIKHGRADRIRITLSQDADAIRLVIEDNGAGFAPSQARAESTTGSHFGIASMHQRAKCLGGSLVIQSAPGAGTQVFAVWPCASFDI
jgi:signal transduction histidine kinase